MSVSSLWAEPLGAVLTMDDVSDTVRDACSACGGPRMIRYETDHGHASWCPRFNNWYRIHVFTSVRTENDDHRRRTNDGDVLVARSLWAGGADVGEIAEALNLPDWVIRKWLI